MIAARSFIFVPGPPAPASMPNTAVVYFSVAGINNHAQELANTVTLHRLSTFTGL
jgi:hypothetical protein